MQKFSVEELVRIISGLEIVERIVVLGVLKGKIDAFTISLINNLKTPHDEQPDLLRAIANWSLEDFPAPHEDDTILTLLEELLESKR